jgi:hypothetical protein
MRLLPRNTTPFTSPRTPEASAPCCKMTIIKVLHNGTKKLAEARKLHDLVYGFRFRCRTFKCGSFVSVEEVETKA